MKRTGSSESLGALMSICPTTEEHSPTARNTHMYSREFQCMLDGLDEEGCVEELGHSSEKKRRLSVDQVKALEKNFEVENKLEPERKVKLAQELGLQPRQVAVWFQNRRARWKTKQLERDYGLLKANYDSLKLNYDSLQRDNESLLKEIRELKQKLNEDNMEIHPVVKEEVIISKSGEAIERSEIPVPAATPFVNAAADTNNNSTINFDSIFHVADGEDISVFPDLKDGSSDSDSSAILNDDNSSNSPNPGAFQSSLSHRLACSSQAYYQPHFVKMEEHNFFGGEESCNFFSDEQAPTLHWYNPDDQWNEKNIQEIINASSG